MTRRCASWRPPSSATAAPSWARYRDPFGGTPVLLVALPIDRVEPTPYQRDPSEPHVKRLMTVIEKSAASSIRSSSSATTTVLDAERQPPPAGDAEARRAGRSSALLVPDADVAFKILALNTEKAHNLKEKSLETIRMARALAKRGDADRKATFAFEFEQPPFLTLGVATKSGRA